MCMLGHDLPPEATAPGTWMHDALAVRGGRWESRILRTASWSPLYWESADGGQVVRPLRRVPAGHARPRPMA